MARQSLWLEMSYLIKHLSLQQLIPRITHAHTNTRMRAHIQGEHSNTYIQRLWKTSKLPQSRQLVSRLIFRPRTSQLRHKSDYYLLQHLVACTKHFKAVKNKKHSYHVQGTGMISFKNNVLYQRKRDVHIVSPIAKTYL